MKLHGTNPLLFLSRNPVVNNSQHRSQNQNQMRGQQVVDVAEVAGAVEAEEDVTMPVEMNQKETEAVVEETEEVTEAEAVVETEVEEMKQKEIEAMEMKRKGIEAVAEEREVEAEVVGQTIHSST